MLELRRKSISSDIHQSIPYITDGLILYLDGINKGSDTGNYWVDLINQVPYKNVGAVPIDDGFSFYGNEYLRAPIRYDLLREDCTIEVVIKRNSSSWASIFSSGIEDGISYQVTADNGFGISSVNKSTTNEKMPKFIYPEDTFGKKITSSANKNFAVTNLLSNERNGNTAFSAYGYSVIGGRWYDSQFYTTGRFIGDIHCIRVYRRHLSKDEMLFNQQVDNQRFNLGL